MPSNVEIKAKVQDVRLLAARAAGLSDIPVETFQQVDTFFLTDRGRLKLREQPPAPAQLIYYERPDRGGPRPSEYTIFETSGPAELKELLARALGVRGSVEKTRSLYLAGQTRIHLDSVTGLGDFMELEVVLQPGQSVQEGQAIARRFMARLGVAPGDLLEVAYIDLIEAKQQNG